ncbi:hypothetical protein RhiirA1_507607 [Rhizophagus irregularis]|uniref:Actin-like ATPase domain-containing protein n=1 Tax=Rhizophagus irregularis TaxID=588596 RepID=A0A2N0RY64_9GLOM|nr:hypothetical protein RhiirA1_507607 [Rhizophagus irregularis]
MANNISVVVGLDFGIIYSGFSLCYVDDDYDLSKIITNTEWPWEKGKSKTNTALRYDDEFKKVEFWGYPALYKKPNKKSRDNETKPIELFKLHLGNCLEKFKPKLPEPLTYKRAITDYLCKIGELIKETILKYWSGIDFMEHVLLVLTVPDEYSENDIAILRECIFNAGLISDKRSERLQFTTELEAVAIYCMYSSLREHRLKEPGTTFMIVDSGGKYQLSEITKRARYLCSTFIDKEFIELLKREVGNSAIDLFSDNHYGQLQYLVHEFCQHVKLPFSGNNPYFSYEIDLEEIAPALLQYVTAIFLVGGFGQSKYLQKRVDEVFSKSVENILIPNQPVTAVSRGATIYGKGLLESRNLNNVKYVIPTRVLIYTFGVKISPLCEYGDPLDRLTSDGRIHKFRRIVERNTEITIDQEFIVENLVPIHPDQTKMSFEIYYTKEQNAVYCDEPGMKLAGSLLIDLPDVHLGTNSPCTFCLSFGDMEIKAKAFNKLNGQNYQTKFENTHSSRVIWITTVNQTVIISR